VTGRVDAHRGVDLRENRFLRLVIDQNDPVEIDLGTAGERPRATLINEIVAKINADLQMTAPPAAHNGRRLILSSPTTGPHSRIRFEPPRTADALPLLLGVEPGEYRGENKIGVRFVGTADLSNGLDLSEAGRVKIGLDDAEPVEIDCTANAANPQQVNLNEIIIALNLSLGQNVVTHDGRFVIIASPVTGAASRLRFLLPETGDATRAIFGIDAPRE